MIIVQELITQDAIDKVAVCPTTQQMKAGNFSLTGK
jgi:hypothetical protein